MKNKLFKSKISRAIHELAEDLHSVGAIDDKAMRRYDHSCLKPIPQVKPMEIRALRDREAVSQVAFARHLNITPGLVSQWERGEKKPSGPSLKLLDLVQRKGLEAII